MNKATLRVPLGQYGFVEREYEDAPDNKFLVDEYKHIQELYSEKPKLKTNNPTTIGQTMEEGGHTYKAVQNEKTQELYWMIDKI